MHDRELTDAFNAAEFGRYIRSRWKTIAASVTAAVVLAAGASLILPKRYTATASLTIEISAGADPRAAAAISPVYLESLKTYERFASSDTIFLEAINALGIRSRFPRSTVESLKASALRITKPASTRVLEISATLDDAVAAQRLANYIAQKTVELNRSLETRSARDAATDAEAILKAASERLARANRARAIFSETQQVDSLAAEIDNMAELRFDLARDLQEAKSTLREFEARERREAGGSSAEAEAAQARISTIEQQDAALAKAIKAKSPVLERLKERRDELDSEQRAARAELEAAKNRLSEAHASIAYHGDRISILDPGIVPERPSFPNPVLNVAVALLLSLAGAVSWIAFRYGYDRSKVEPVKRSYSFAD